jgi:hypothetical protein
MINLLLCDDCLALNYVREGWIILGGHLLTAWFLTGLTAGLLGFAGSHAIVRGKFAL